MNGTAAAVCVSDCVLECDARVTEVLAERAMNWTVTPDRFVAGERSWLPRWRFQPCAHVTDAMRVLNTLGAEYRLNVNAAYCRAEVRCGRARGQYTCRDMARAISYAAAIVLGFDANQFLGNPPKGEVL